ncbi:MULTISPECIES: hypothetical protein [unclassified Herbaspirillum]|nr:MULTISPECIES: hypothetical protein [unclassified Herbaspirillum]MAF04959.1 hypothetical protein [Herbaspirillum sp.]MBO18507.1 hypothetical protein [Herbaspirillum sp.]|tara:strand:+ start:552 stop:1754 length:1203 start_codon:yes stop_codon:yes gene_type:complete
MAIDANILFQAGRPTVQLDDPMNKLAQLGQVQGFQNQNALAQLQLKQAQQQDQDRTAMANAYQGAVDPATGRVDYAKVTGNLAGAGAGAAIPGVQKSAAEAQKAQREADKATLEQAIQKQALISQYAGSATDQTSWTAALKAVAQMGVDTSQIPEQFDPATAKQLQLRALTGVQQLDQHWKQQGYDLDVRKQTEVERNNQAQNKIAQGQLGVAQGQLGVAQAGLGLRRQELEAGKVPPGYRRTADGNLEAVPGGPADIKINKEANQRTQDAKDVLAIADEADQLLGKASNGPISSGYNQALGAFGSSTEAAQADAQLKVLQGAMVSKMPKMSGPQSDKDVLLYREMAGQIGDPLVPIAQRRAALQTVRRLQQKYLGQDTAAPAAAAPAASSDGWSVTQVK